MLDECFKDDRTLKLTSDEDRNQTSVEKAPSSNQGRTNLLTFALDLYKPFSGLRVVNKYTGNNMFIANVIASRT